MINKFNLLLFIALLTTCVIKAQTASTYFPSQTGHKWYFKTEVLDTLNNPVDSLTTFRIDSFATTSTYKDKEAKVVLSKSGPELTILFQPYLDTNYVNLSGNDGNVYFRIANSEAIRLLLDSLEFDSSFFNFDSLLRTLISFEKWYPFYKFANSVNSNYTIFSYDTTVTIDTFTLPLRFEILGRRIADGSLSTPIGAFDCKRFLQRYRISYRQQILPPPFPAVIIPLVTVSDSIYIAPGNWILQSTIPSTIIDLSILQLPVFSIPGLRVTSIPEIQPPVSAEERIVPGTSALSLKIYPNPSAASLTLRYNLPAEISDKRSAKVSIKLFDALGVEIATLFDGYAEKNENEFSVNLHKIKGGKMPNGIYFVRIVSGSQIAIKKIVLIN